MDNNTSASSQGLLFCHKCGARLLSDSVFCSKCGTKVEVSLNRGPAVNQTFSIPSENNEDKVYEYILNSYQVYGVQGVYVQNIYNYQFDPVFWYNILKRSGSFC